MKTGYITNQLWKTRCLCYCRLLAWVVKVFRILSTRLLSIRSPQAMNIFASHGYNLRLKHKSCYNVAKYLIIIGISLYHIYAFFYKINYLYFYWYSWLKNILWGWILDETLYIQWKFLCNLRWHKLEFESEIRRGLDSKEHIPKPRKPGSTLYKTEFRIW